MEGYKSWKAWLFLSPVLILMAIFTFYPLINTFVYAFQWDYVGHQGYIPNAADVDFKFGIGSFQKVFDGGSTSIKFFQALFVTVILIVTVPISVFLALLISVALSNIKTLQKLFQTIYFLPYVTNTLAIGAVFAVIFQSGDQMGSTGVAGFINTIIKACGGNEINWLGQTLAGQIWPGVIECTWPNIFVMIIYIVWNTLPFKILILTGSLASMNKQYYDAAKIDGASKGRILSRITIPLLSPMISYLLITGFIGAFKEYTAVVGVFGPEMGTQGEMNTVVGLIYDYINRGKYGYASVMALVLFAIILALTGVQTLINKKRVHF